MAWTNSHAACQTELFLFHPIIQDLLYCPADVHGCAWRGGSPMPRTFQREISMCARRRLDGAGEETVGVHIPKAELPCVDQRHLALLPETWLSQQDLPKNSGDEGVTASPPPFSSTPHPGHSGSEGSGAAASSEPLLPCMRLPSSVVGCVVVYGGTWRLAEWIFPNECASVDAVHSISPHPCCYCHWLFLNRLHGVFFSVGKFSSSSPAPPI